VRRGQYRLNVSKLYIYKHMFVNVQLEFVEFFMEGVACCVDK
jgi:hypothetical protein